MPNINIHDELKALKIDEQIKKNIKVLENFVEENKSTRLSVLIAPTYNLTPEFSIIKKSLEDSNNLAIIANGLSNKNLDQILLDIKTKKREIRDNYRSLKNENSIQILDAEKNRLEKELKKPLNQRNEAAIGRAENTLKLQTILILKEQLKEDKKNFKLATELYNLTSNYPLCLARYFWLKEQCKQNSNYAVSIENLIKEKINIQATTDATGSSHSVSGDITLLDLVKIKDWNSFKLNFGKQLKEHYSKKKETLPSTNKTSDTLIEENSNLLKERNQLKAKITDLETQLSTTHADLETYKLTSTEFANLNIEPSNVSLDLKDENINLNKQLLAVNEKNEILIEEIDTEKNKNAELEKDYATLKNALQKYKSELEVKNKQIAENSDLLRQKREIHLTTNKLQAKEKEQDASQKKHVELSNELAKVSNELLKKKQTLDETSSTLNDLKIEYNKVQLSNTSLETEIEQTKLYNTELLKQKKQEITNLQVELKGFKAKLAEKKLELDSHCDSNSQNLLDLEAIINEKNSILDKLSNEFKDLQKKEKTFIKETEALKNKLAEESKQLADKDEQFQKLTKQFSSLSDHKEELEKKYQTQLTEYEALKIKYESDTNKLKEELVNFQERAKLTESEATKLKEKVHSLEKNLEKDKNNLSKYIKQISKLRNNQSILETQLSTSEQDFNTKLRKVEEEKHTLSEELDEVTAAHTLFVDRANRALVNISPPNNYLSHPVSESAKEKALEEIFQKIAFLNTLVTQKENDIQKLQNEVTTIKAELDKKDSQTLILQDTSNIFLDDSLNELSALTKTLEKPKPEIPKKFDLNQDFFDDFDDDNNSQTNNDDDHTFMDNFDNDLNLDFEDPLTLLAKQLNSTEKLLAEKEAELAQRQKEIDELASLLKETRHRLTESQDSKASLKNEQVEALDSLKIHYEKLIQQLTSQITDKQTDLKDLSEKLNTADQQVQQLNQTLSLVETEKANLESKLAQLKQENFELQQKLDQGSANDAHLAALEQEKTTIEKELQELKNKSENLEEKFKNNQTAYRESKEEYDKLDKAFKKQSQELNQTITDLKASNAKLKEIYEELENLKIDVADAKQFNQQELSNSKKEEGSMMNGEVNPPLNNPIYEEFDSSHDTKSKVGPPVLSAKDSDSSSGHSSRNSSSSYLNEDEDPLEYTASQQENNPQQPSSSDEAFSDASSNDLQSLHRSASLKSILSEHNLTHLSDGENVSLNETEAELLKNPDSRPSIPAEPTTSISQQQDQDALEKVKQGVNAAFKQENHSEIIHALINKFLKIATYAANKLLNDDVNNILPRFEQELEKIASNQITRSIFPYVNSPGFKTEISKKIHYDKLKPSNYLEEITNSTESIFAGLKIRGSEQNYIDNIADQGKDLLIKLCIEDLQASEKEGLLELAKNSLENQASKNNLQATEYAETIQKTAEKLVTEQLEAENLQKTLEKTASQPIANENLLVASQQTLRNQLEQQIIDNFVHYFPNLHLDPILEKINNGKALSDEEIAKLPSELQYPDTIKEFVSGLRVKYPNLASSYENKINENTFKKTRLILRKNALNALPLAAFEDKEILDLSAKLWLEKKLQHITKNSISLTLHERDQKDLDNNFQKYFRLSSLEDMAITHKSIDELKNELKKLHDFKLKITTELSRAFSEIESKLLEYPNLITEDGSFQANLNNALPLNFPKLNDSDRYPMLSTIQIQILLDKINQHIKNDVSKWSLLNNNKIAQEIANNIISDSTNPFESDTDIQRLVSDSLTILYKRHDLQETLEKRKYWDSEIQQRYALTQKLKSSSHFHQMVEDRISKLEEMLNLKENDANENVKALPKAVYLPNKCRVIPNLQFDSSEDAEEYHLHVDNFYKQDAIKVGKKITFSQKLANEDECKWSATLNTDKCLSFKTQKKRFRREKSYLQEVSFAQMVYSVNSFKDAKTCTLNFGNCSQNMKERLYLFAKAYNELRLEDNELQKRPKINCNIKNSPNLDKAKIAAVKEEIKAQLNLHSNELEDISTKLKDDTIRHQIIRSRG